MIWLFKFLPSGLWCHINDTMKLSGKQKKILRKIYEDPIRSDVA